MNNLFKTHLEAGLVDGGVDEKTGQQVWIGTDKEWKKYAELEADITAKRVYIEKVSGFEEGELDEWDEERINEEHYKLFQSEVLS